MAGRQPGGAAMKALLHGIAEGNGRTLRNLLGLLIFIGGGYLLGRHALLLAELNLPAPIVLALKGGLLCAFGTALGAMPVLVVKTMPARLSDALLGFGAGVMLSATAFSLIMPALSAAGDLGYSKFGAGFLVSFGLAVGVMGLFILGRLMPDVHPGCEARHCPVAFPAHPAVRHGHRPAQHPRRHGGWRVGRCRPGRGERPRPGHRSAGCAGRSGGGAGAGRSRYVAFQGDAGRCRVGPGRAAVRGALRLAGRPLRAAPALGAGRRGERCSSWSPTRSFPSPTARDMPPRLRWAWCSVSA